MKHKKITDPIYNAEVHIIYNCTHDEMNKKLNKLYKNIEEDKEQCVNKAECFRLIHYNNYKNYILWFLDFKIKADTLYVIAHEVSHLVDNVFEDRGVKNDTEARAYYLEYWVRQLWRLCSK